MNSVRFIFLAILKIAGYAVYPSKLQWISKPPRQWEDVSLLLVLNHTSLFEFVYGVTLPFRFLWELATRLVIPVADITLQKPFAGLVFKHLAPKTLGLSRKRDHSWQQFLNKIESHDICIFMPEGEMKRRNGLNKNNQPMTVKKGVFDLLQKYRGQNMVIVYSQGLHHVFAPGDSFPRLFRKIEAKIEYLPVNDYLSSFSQPCTAQQISKDLERRRDLNCN